MGPWPYSGLVGTSRELLTADGLCGIWVFAGGLVDEGEGAVGDVLTEGDDAGSAEDCGVVVDGVDDALEVEVGGGDAADEEVSGAGDGVGFEYFGDGFEVAGDGVVEAVLADFEGDEGSDGVADGGGVDGGGEVGDDAAAEEPVEAGVDGAAGYAETPGEVQDGHTGVLSQQFDERCVEFVDIVIVPGHGGCLFVGLAGGLLNNVSIMALAPCLGKRAGYSDRRAALGGHLTARVHD